MDKILKVCGRGKIRLRPDTVCAQMTLQGTRENYPLALKSAQTELEQVKSAIERAGFSKEELKTSDFRVETKYEGYRDEKGEWKQKFVGYQYSHVLQIRFAADNALLGKFIAALVSCGAEPLFSFSYTVKDAEAAKEWLLKEAVKDCAKKAITLAQAACVDLLGIRQIDYTWGDKDFAVRPVQPMQLRAAASEASAFSLDVTPEDVEVTDTVTVVWEIE